MDLNQAAGLKVGAHIPAIDVGDEVGGWKLLEYLGAGNSAKVYKASKNGTFRAVKVFQPGMDAEAPSEEVVARLERQLSLVGKRHPNLVEIFEGGHCPKSQRHFLVMELIDAPDMAKVLREIPRNKIEGLISQIASAMKFLEDLGFAHRDIKPGNIAVSRDFGRAVVLDLGVMRPHGPSDLTDKPNKKPNVATKRYTPPSLLRHRNGDSMEDWRAITFYQLGAVLYDMITGTQLFLENSVTDWDLFQAIDHLQPEIASGSASPYLIQLAHNCLVKDDQVRLRLVSWEKFEFPRKVISSHDAIRARVSTRISMAEDVNKGPIGDARKSAIRMALHKHSESIQSIVRTICVRNPLFPGIIGDTQPSFEVGKSSCIWTLKLEASKKHGIRAPLYLAFTINILEPTEDLIQVLVTGVLAKNGYVATERSNWLTVSEGKIVWEGMTDEIESILIMLLDNAQVQSVTKAADIDEGAEVWLRIEPEVNNYE